MARAKTEAAEDAAAELAQRLQDLQVDISALVESLKALGIAEARSVTGTIKEAVDVAGEIVKITAPEAHHRGEMAAEGIGAVTGRNPVATVPLSAAVGFVVGAMARR